MFGVEHVSEEWADYGFRELYLTWDGRPVPWKAIVRDGRLVHIASRQYKLLPNEVALKAADRVAKELNAEKVGEFLDPCGRLYALYDMKIEAEPIRGVRTRLGIYVYNSVNGELAFGASVLSILVKGADTFYSFLPYKFVTTYLSPDAAIAIVREPHRPGLTTDIEEIAKKLLRLVDRGREALGIYRLWAEIELDRELAQAIYDRLPKAYLPNYIKAMKDGVTLMELLTVWDAYVDICSRIWRGKNSGKEATIDRKIELYRMLHAALPREKEKR